MTFLENALVSLGLQIVFQKVYILHICYAQYNFEYNLKQVYLQFRA